eukprot:UN09949
MYSLCKDQYHRIFEKSIYSSRNLFNPITNSNFIDKTSINNVFKLFYHFKSWIYYDTNQPSISISNLPIYGKLHLSWDIHPTG